MILEHSVQNADNLLRILAEGIQPRSVTKKKDNYGVARSHPDYIYIIAFPFFSRQAWGHYHLSLKEDYLREHIEQFRECAERPHDPRFAGFIKENGIISLTEGYRPEAYRQIISLKPIPVQGLDCLGIDYGYYSDEVLVRIKQALPQHMSLYLEQGHAGGSMERANLQLSAQKSDSPPKTL